jgi:dihydroneopterin aldolase
MSDIIRIVDLEVWSYIGVPDAERVQPQRLLVTLELQCASFSHAAGTDNIAWTINYAQVAEHARQLAMKRARHLIETLAEELAADLLKAFAIRKIDIEIKKFPLPDAQHVSVRIERAKE